MIALLIGLAIAGESPASCAPETIVPALAERGDRELYLCIVEREDARQPLLDALRASGEESAAHSRYTRALALWLIPRSDAPWDPAHVRLLNAGDRRLLADGVRAFTGQKSGSDEHEAVFAQQPWYAPRDNWTVGRLTEAQRANIAMADDPPAEAAPEVAVAPPLQGEAPPPAETISAPACGCDGSGGMLALPGIAAAALLRRRAPSPRAATAAAPTATPMRTATPTATATPGA